MVHHHRTKHDLFDLRFYVYSSLKHRMKTRPPLLRLFVFLSAFSFAFILLFSSLRFPSSLSCSDGDDRNPPFGPDRPLCSLHLDDDTICCDRSSLRTDVCFVSGDVRTDSSSNTIVLLSNKSAAVVSGAEEERIRPYTRKWEQNTMARIDELRLLRLPTNGSSTAAAHCDVTHDVPAVFFSTGGYTGNVYHEFNDGIVPLYITSHRFDRKVVFVIVEYHNWWITKYQDILSRLSDYPPIDFAGDRRTHCFPEAIVGLEIHDELSIDPGRMSRNRTIRDFRRLLDESYRPRINWIAKEEEGKSASSAEEGGKPKLVVVSRNGSRGIENQEELVRAAEEVGFRVEVLEPRKTTELAKMYRGLNGSEVMVGVHGAAMTHFLFMRPGSVFVQIVPLGTDWAAEAYYGGPAAKLGLKYVRYKIGPKESSLSREYGEEDPVLRDPDSVNRKGWEVTKRVYLDGQNVRLDMRRMRKKLVKAFEYVERKRRSDVW